MNVKNTCVLCKILEPVLCQILSKKVLMILDFLYWISEYLQNTILDLDFVYENYVEKRI